MKRRRLVYALDLLLVALVVTEGFLVRGDVISLGQALIVVALIEALLLAVGLRQTLTVSRAYRQHRAGGADGWQAFAGGLEAVLPTPMARFVALEPQLWHCFYRWVARRPLPSGSFVYHRRSPLGPLLLVLAVTTPAEILLVEILVPWTWVRVLFLIAALYACFWVVAFYASLATLPHRLFAAGVELRYGALNVGLLPYAAIVDVEEARLRPPTRTEGLRVDEAAATAWLTVGGRTDVTVTLSSPQAFRTLRGEGPPVTIVHAAADRPVELASALRGRIGRDLSHAADKGRQPGPDQGSSRPSGSEAAASSAR